LDGLRSREERSGESFLKGKAFREGERVRKEAEKRRVAEEEENERKKRERAEVRSSLNDLTAKHPPTNNRLKSIRLQHPEIHISGRFYTGKTRTVSSSSDTNPV
jgi:hypothetical protein